MPKRVIGFLLWCAVLLAAYSVPLLRLVRYALHEGYSSHIVLVPFIVSYLIWVGRDRIFSAPRYSFIIAGLIAAFGIVLAILGFALTRSSVAPLLIVLSVLVMIVAGFVGSFGTAAIRQAMFPVSLLVFMLPVPGYLLDRIIFFLQSESADLTHWLFSVLGVPVLRNGFVLTVPGATIEVAAECSGINSSIALMILMIVFAYETLHSSWRRALLILLMIPLSIVKNAIRIVTLTMLAIRVDPSFLTGKLHHRGGFVFFLIALALLYPIWALLRKSETSGEQKDRNTLQPVGSAHR